MVLPHLTLTEELEFICNWANTDGTKSCLPEIFKQIDAIKLKVREQINLRFVPFLHLTCFSLFSQESELRKELLDLLTSVINQGGALSCNLASYQTWIGSYGQDVSLNAISDKLEKAKTEVGDTPFMVWKWLKLCSSSSFVSPLNYSSYE